MGFHGTLLLVHALVGELFGGFEHVCLRGVMGIAVGDLERHRRFCLGVVGSGGLLHLRERLLDLGDTALLCDDNELIAAGTEGGAKLCEAVADDIGCGDDKAVALGMTIDIVDLFQKVDVVPSAAVQPSVSSVTSSLKVLFCGAQHRNTITVPPQGAEDRQGAGRFLSGISSSDPSVSVRYLGGLLLLYTMEWKKERLGMGRIHRGERRLWRRGCMWKTQMIRELT